MRCVLPSADSKSLETEERDERHFKLIIALVHLTFHIPQLEQGSEWAYRESWWVDWPWTGVRAWNWEVPLLMERLHVVGEECSHCVRGDWTEVWSNTVMMQENFTLEKTLNYNFNGKRNGRTK